MTENREVTIKFSKKLHWNWHISCGTWQVAGYGDSLDDAEKQAFKTLRGIPNHGTVHAIYEDGKPVKPAVGTFSDALINDGFNKDGEQK